MRLSFSAGRGSAARSRRLRSWSAARVSQRPTPSAWQHQKTPLQVSAQTRLSLHLPCRFALDVKPVAAGLPSLAARARLRETRLVHLPGLLFSFALHFLCIPFFAGSFFCFLLLFLLLLPFLLSCRLSLYLRLFCFRCRLPLLPAGVLAAVSLRSGLSAFHASTKLSARVLAGLGDFLSLRPHVLAVGHRHAFAHFALCASRVAVALQVVPHMGQLAARAQPA